MIRPLLPSTGFPGTGSPTSPVLWEAPTSGRSSLRTSLPSLGGAPRSARRRRVPSRRSGRISWVPGGPRCARALLFDPGGCATSGHCEVTRYAGRSCKSSARHHDSFEARSHGPHARCLRFAAGVTSPPRKTRFRSVASGYRAGLATRWVPKKVSLNSSEILLRQAVSQRTPAHAR